MGTILNPRITKSTLTGNEEFEVRDRITKKKYFQNVQDIAKFIDIDTVPPVGIVNNAKTAGCELTIVSRPDDYVANVQATGTITITDTPIEDETLTVHDQVFTFKTERTGVGEITIDADNGIQAANIVTAIGLDLTEVTAVAVSNVVNLTAIETAPYIGTGGNTIVLTEAATGVDVSGAGTLTNGVDEVLSYLSINGINYIFAVDTGDDPSVDYPSSSPVITAIGATMEDIAAALVVALKLDTTAFSASSVSNLAEVVTVNYKTIGVIGNTVTYVNNLVVAGDITDTGITNGLFTGGVDGTPGRIGEIRSNGAILYLCTATELTIANANWVSTTLTTF